MYLHRHRTRAAYSLAIRLVDAAFISLAPCFGEE